MKQIALSIDTMKHLESLGLDTSDASMYWFIANPDIEHFLIDLRVYPFITPQKDDRYSIPAYTFQDMLKLILPLSLKDSEYFSVMPNENITIMSCSFEGDYKVRTFDGGMLYSAYNAFLWCIENNYIKTNKV